MSRVPYFPLSRKRYGYLLVLLPLLVRVVFIGSMRFQPDYPGVHPDSSIGGCPLFPVNNIWNTDISRLPVDARSAQYIASIGLAGHMHADFGAGLYNGEPIGIPYAVVPANQPLVPVHFDYADESDPGPYPVPSNVPIEGGPQSSGDRYVLLIQQGSCNLYEMYASYPQSDRSWQAGSGAVWNFGSNMLRPAGWTSADAAGLPILPGLVRYDEVASGAITHALRFTVQRTQKAYVWPARHQASSTTDPTLPPMGLRVRLKANVDICLFRLPIRLFLPRSNSMACSLPIMAAIGFFLVRQMIAGTMMIWHNCAIFRERILRLWIRHHCKSAPILVLLVGGLGVILVLGMEVRRRIRPGRQGP